MTTEGDPVSQKSIKGLLQGNFIKNIRFEPSYISSTTTTSNWQANQNNGLGDQNQSNVSYYPIRSLDAPAGPGTFYLSTSGSMMHLYFGPKIQFNNCLVLYLVLQVIIKLVIWHLVMVYSGQMQQGNIWQIGDSVVWDHSGSMFQNHGRLTTILQ